MAGGLILMNIGGDREGRKGWEGKGIIRLLAFERRRASFGKFEHIIYAMAGHRKVVPAIESRSFLFF